MSTAGTMKSMYSLLDVLSWVEDFDSSTKDSASRATTCSNFVMLAELEDSVRRILDRIFRRHGRGFLITGLYGSGKTLFLAFLSALLTEPVLLKTLLDRKPEWSLDELAARKYLTINFTAIANQDLGLDESLWEAVHRTLRTLSPPIHATISDVDNFLDMFELLGKGARNDVDEWLKEQRNLSLDRVKEYQPPYQKQQLESALADLGIQLRDFRTTLAEKVQILIDKARERGYDGVVVFIDELYLHLIQSDETFNKDTNFLSQLAQAALVEDRPFWVFAAMQEEIQAIARQAGRNYNTELMGRLAGEGGRFQNINLPVTQFHRIYNRRLFKMGTKKIHRLADLFRSDIQPHYRGSFSDFFRKYFREAEPVIDEAKHFADVYPVHPYAMHCLTKITNAGGRSRGALGFVDDFCKKAEADGRPWHAVALLDDVFNYPDLRSKIIQDNPDIERFYGLFERFCGGPRDAVLSKSPYRRLVEGTKAFAKTASERLIKALIVLAMVKEELTLCELTDALMLRWPGKEHDPADSDQEVARLLDKMSNHFSPLRKKGEELNPTFFLSVEGDGEERDELQVEIERVINGQEHLLEKDSGYRSQLTLFLRQTGPVGDTTAPAKNLKSELGVNWQRTDRSALYMLEAATSMTSEAAVAGFLSEVPVSRCLHLLILFPAASPLDVEMDTVKAGSGKVLVWLPQTLSAQDVEELRRSMALVRLYGDYDAKVRAGDPSISDKRKLEILSEELGMATTRSDPRPSPQATAVLRRAFLNGRIYHWNKKDDAWEELFSPGELLSLITGIPEDRQSLGAVVEQFAAATLPKEHPLHPDFQTAFNFSADLSSTMQKRVLQAIWRGRATDDDGTNAKRDLEKHLAPLGLLDTSRPGEVVVTVSPSSNECFRKIRERVQDRIRKSTADPREINVTDLREDLAGKDTGLTQGWIDILLTLLLVRGDVTGVTGDGQIITAESKDVGEPRDWLTRLTKLRAGGKPDEALWKDVVCSVRALGHWEEGFTYSPTAADKLHQQILQAAAAAETELAEANQTLVPWPTAVVPDAVTEQADLFNVPDESRGNQSACFRAIRDALRDIVGLPADDEVDQPNRYQVVKDWATQQLQAARDFLSRAAELKVIADRLAQLEGAVLPASLAASRDELSEKLEMYVTRADGTCSFAEIVGLWEDFHSDFRHQYASEHAGVHNQLRDVQSRVVDGEEFSLLKNFAAVAGLSAHYGPARIEQEVVALLQKVGVTAICPPSPEGLESDLAEGWKCSSCSYVIGSIAPVTADHLLGHIQTGIDEFLSQVRGFEAEVRDYVSEHAEAAPLAGLLEDPLPAGALEVLADDTMRLHLASALEDARAQRVDIDDLLAKLKPRLLGTYGDGASGFRARVDEELSRAIADADVETGQPWKVE